MAALQQKTRLWFHKMKSIVTVVVVSCPPGPNTRPGPRCHVALTVPQVHFPSHSQQPRRDANTVNDMSRRSRIGTRARGISLFFVDELQAFDIATTKSGQCTFRL
ncbi:hypothetical protein AVEN_215445-1 [Araneus ventricosus]|uniref:Uncharacterized protein n=1 Tax=Araneus ventricosus TaxID=182803 RepID=A0A4Y2KR27_ARAVE|nr:hypothetical protein AVEN_215445-1 [Araneus ventricosus]